MMHRSLLRLCNSSKPFSDCLISKNSRNFATGSLPNPAAAAIEAGGQEPTEEQEKNRSHREVLLEKNQSGDNRPIPENEYMLLNKLLTPSEYANLQRIKFEYQTWKHVDAYMPEFLTDSILSELLAIPTPLHRLIYLQKEGARIRRYFALKEAKAELRRNAPTQKEKIDRIKNHPHIYYGFGGNCVFQRIESQSIKRWSYARYASHYPISKLTVLYDMSLIRHLDYLLQKRTAFFLRSAWNRNVEHRSPCRMIFTGMDYESTFYKDILNEYFLPLGFDDDPIEHTDKSYTDLYPINQLLYLSPDAPKLLTEVDEDRVYIVGGFCDGRSVRQGLTLGEAKRRGIEARRLPIDLYIDWGRGSKNLNHDQVQQILLDAHMTRNWKWTFQNNLPGWHFVQATETSYERKIANQERLRLRDERNAFLLQLVDQK